MCNKSTRYQGNRISLDKQYKIKGINSSTKQSDLKSRKFMKQIISIAVKSFKMKYNFLQKETISRIFEASSNFIIHYGKLRSQLLGQRTQKTWYCIFKEPTQPNERTEIHCAATNLFIATNISLRTTFVLPSKQKTEKQRFLTLINV